MKAWITSRRVKPGTQQQFRQRWHEGSKPAGAKAAHLIQSDDDAQELLSISFWDDEHALQQQRADAQAQRRPDTFADLADVQWDRSFNVMAPPSHRGRGLWLALPAGTAIAGAGVYVWRQQHRNRNLVLRVTEQRPVWLLPIVLGPIAAAFVLLVRRLRGQDEFSPATHQPTPIPASTPPMQPAATDGESAPLEALTRERWDDIEQHGLLVREIMTPNPETVEFDADLETAAAKMRDLNVGVLPVMADGSVAGIITDRDLAMAIAGEVEHNRHQVVGDVMSSMPVTVGPNATVQEASQLMAAHKIRRLLVVQGTKLAGILSIGDLAVDDGGPDVQEAFEEISEPARPQR